jgi:hypothetical protein
MIDIINYPFESGLSKTTIGYHHRRKAYRKGTTVIFIG